MLSASKDDLMLIPTDGGRGGGAQLEPGKPAAGRFELLETGDGCQKDGRPERQNVTSS